MRRIESDAGAVELNRVRVLEQLAQSVQRSTKRSAREVAFELGPEGCRQTVDGNRQARAAGEVLQQLQGLARKLAVGTSGASLTVK